MNLKLQPLKRSINIWNGIDKTAIVLFLLLIFMGWINIYAAVYNEEHSGILDMSQRYGKQFLWIIASLVLAVFIVIIDNRFYFFFSWFIYGVCMLLLVLVVLVGKEINGAKSWFEFGSISLQPSELAKFGTSLALASYLNSKRQDLTRISVFIPATAIIILPAMLTLLQPDMGSAIVYFSLFIVLFREGMSPYIFVSGIACDRVVFSHAPFKQGFSYNWTDNQLHLFLSGLLRAGTNWYFRQP